MIRRILDALHRELPEQAPLQPLRPNALSRETAREERLRREARLPEAARRQPAAPAEEGRPRREPLPTPAADLARDATLGASLKSPSEFRRAWLLKEILGPPAALRWPRNEEPEAWDR